MHYFDHLSARPPRASALQKYNQACQDLWAHPASVHRLGQDTLSELHRSYLDLSCFFEASERDTVLFCNSLEEAVAQVIQGVWCDFSRPSGRNHFLTSNLDEAPIILNLEKISSLGASHDLVESTPLGTIDLEAFQESIHPRTQLVALSWANALTGVIQPVHEIAKICRERGLFLFLEASNLSGFYSLELPTLQPDFVSISGTSIGALAGSAALWMRHDRRLSPLLPCGHDWMHSTASHPGALMALAIAAREAREQRDRSLWKLASLRSRFENRLQENCPHVEVLFESSERLVHVSAIAFKGVHSELLNWHLNRRQIYTSFGGGTRQQMHYLLKACKIDPKIQHSALSFSFHPSLSEEQIDQAADTITACVQQLRRYHNFEI